MGYLPFFSFGAASSAATASSALICRARQCCRAGTPMRAAPLEIFRRRHRKFAARPAVASPALQTMAEAEGQSSVADFVAPLYALGFEFFASTCRLLRCADSSLCTAHRHQC